MTLSKTHLVTASLDDSLRVTPLDKLHFDAATIIPLDGPPAGVAVGTEKEGLIVTATNKSIFVFDFKAGKATPTIKKDAAALSPQAVALSPNDSLIAIGSEKNNIHLFTIKGNELVDAGVLEQHRGPITRLDFSKDGQYLASADRNREVIVWDLKTKEVKSNSWVYHTARIDALAFSPSSTHVASSGLDQTIIIWSVASPSTRVTIKGAHQGGVTEVVWLDDNTVATTGQDCTIRTWTVL